MYSIALLVIVSAAVYVGTYMMADSDKLLHPLRLAFEAAVVGGGLVVLFFAVHALFMKLYGNDAMMHHGLLALQIFLAGALFHGLFEITTGNHVYCAARK